MSPASGTSIEDGLSASEVEDETPETPAPAHSPDLPSVAPSRDIEEIPIRGRAAQGVDPSGGISVTRFDSSDLAALGVADVADLAQATPHLEIREASGTTASFFIRGVGLNDFTANAATSVAIYQDDVAIALPAISLGQLYDIESIDVVRGPQGSGPGRNASAGALHIYTHKPGGELTAKLRSEFGFGQIHGYAHRDFEAALGYPILSDTLSGRLSFRFRQQDPYVRNRCQTDVPRGRARVTDPSMRQQPDTPRICGESFRTVTNEDMQPGESPLWELSQVPPNLPHKVNDANNWSARSLLRFRPPDSDLDLLLNLHVGRLDQLPPLGQTIGTRGGSGIQGFYGGETNTNYRAREITSELRRIEERLGLTSLPPGPERDAVRNATRLKLGRNLARRLDKKPYTGDYNREGRERLESWGSSLRADADFEAVRVTGIAAYEGYERHRRVDADYSPDRLLEDTIDDDGWQVSLDLRSEGDLGDQEALWNAGFYYLLDKIEYLSNTPTAPPLPALLRQYEQVSHSVGVYGGFEWDFVDDFTLEAGARYNWEQKDFDVNLIRAERLDVCTGLVIDLNVQVGSGQECADTAVFDSLTGSVALRYRLDDARSLYWKYGRGWKGAQLNAGGASGAAFTLADPEALDAFEFGGSGSWFEGRLSVRAAAFWYRYENYQVFLTQNDEFTPPQRIVVNASDAVIYGAEVDLELEPIDRLRSTLRGGWLESEFVDFSQRQIRTVPAENPNDPARVLPVIVDFTGNRLPNTPRFSLSGDVQYAIELGRWGTLTPRYDFVFTAENFFDPSEGRGTTNAANLHFMPRHAIGQQAFWLHGVRLTYATADGRIEVAGFVRNLTGEVYKLLAFDASIATGVVGNLVGPPRTFGLAVALHW